MDFYLFILTMFVCMAFASSKGVEESRKHFMDCSCCLRTDIINGTTNWYNATEIPTELGEAIINSKGFDTNNMLRARNELVVNVVNETSLVANWYTNMYTCCLDKLQHFLLKVVQDLDGSQKYTQFLLMNISGSQFDKQKTNFSMNCVRLHPKSYRAEFTLWFLGRLKQSPDGKISADINRDSFIKKEVNLDKEYIKRRRQAEICICSANITIRESASATEGIIKARIQGYEVPEQTPVEIQLVKMVGDKRINKTNVFGKDIKNPFEIKYEVKRGHTYYIRVIRKCSGDYPVSCYKNEADVIRSVDITIEALSTGSPHWVEAAEEDLVADKGVKDLQQVLQLACIIFIFGVCIIAELALICMLCTGILCPQKKVSSVPQNKLYVLLNKDGKPVSKLTKTKRLAIIYTEDSNDHVEKVLQLNENLKSRGIQTTLYGEEYSEEKMRNWIDVAEGVATNFDYILFIVSPNMSMACKRSSCENADVSFADENERPRYLYTLHNVPAVVISALKAQKIWNDKPKRKVYLIYWDKKNKILAKKMQMEHFYIFHKICRY